MTIIQSIILGIVQGLTEFLPISSSAHLVVVPFLLGWNIPEAQIFPFDVLVQLGTLVAVIIYFFSDLWAIVKGWVLGLVHRRPLENNEARLGWLLILASIPATVLAFLIKDQIEAAFSSPAATAGFLFVTALLLLLAEWIGKRGRDLSGMGWIDALVMGIGQALSLFPGISRSGATISSGMLRNLDRRSAARFSFLMSVPVMLGAGLVSAKDLLEVPNLSSFLPVMAIGFITAGVVGYLSIRWMLHFVTTHSLRVFAYYCAALGAVTLLIFYVIR